MPEPQKFEMPSYVVDRVMAKRGRLRVFDKFDPRETALVVIDMQNFYVGDVANAHAIIPQINKLAAAMRARGGTVAWVSMTAGVAGGKSLWPVYHDHFFTPEKAAEHRDNLTEGHKGHELHPDRKVEPQDIHAGKNRFSAFLPQASDLHPKLAARGIRNVLITGMVTNFCSETSARDAMMMDYRVIMVSDGNAARHADDHLNGLTTVFQSFGDVMTTEQVLNEVIPND
jgi:nicotinamidase-related amidase